jgi:ABC-2 type transport system permease protein
MQQNRYTPMPAWHPHSIRRTIRLFFRLQTMQIRVGLEYSSDFWIGMLGSAALHGAGVIFIAAFFSQIPEVDGWNAWEVGLLYSLALIPRGFCELFCDGPWMLRTSVNRGEFDRLLVRPVSPALQMACSIVSLHGFGQLGLGLTVFFVANTQLNIDWSAGKIGFLLMILLSSVVMLAAINFLVNLIGFWEPSAQSAIPTFGAMLIDVAKFPLTVFPPVLQGLIVVVLPYAFITWFPALVLLDRPSDWKWLGYLAPLATLWMVVVTSFLWRRGINRYQGVGH